MIDYMAKISLKGKNSVVTGGAGLIGREVVIALAQAGSHVVIAEINRKKAQAISSELRKRKLDVEYYYLDITDIKSIKKNIKTLIEHLGEVDIWVNCAYPRTDDWGADVEDISSESWQKNVDMHLNSYALSSKYVAEYMKRKGGNIINFSSIYGTLGPDFTIYENTDVKNSMIYAAIKGGIINLGRYLASYFGSYNIRVNTICPGGIFNHQNKVFVENYSRKVPLKRMATADEIASVVVFLASDAASYISGATIMVDGGWSAV